MLPCPIGVVDLRTGELHDGRPEDYLLNACLTEYDPELLKLEDPCPETNAFLLRSMNGNQRLVDFIWRILGYGLIRDRKDHVFIIFWGEHGRNGKDTLLKLVTHVLGLALSGDVQVEMFLQQQQSKSSSSPTPDVLALRGMSIAWINEAEDGQKFALAKLKKLTGGGFITARGLMDKQQTTWLQTHLPIMTTNELPKAKAEDAAFWQRAHIVKWELSFVDDPKEPFERQADKYLDGKIQAEAKSVLARMIPRRTARSGRRLPKKRGPASILGCVARTAAFPCTWISSASHGPKRMRSPRTPKQCWRSGWPITPVNTAARCGMTATGRSGE